MESKILRSGNEIAKTFGVRREKVAQWAREGAPIAVVGGRMKASAGELMQWLAKQKSEARQ